MALHDNEEKRKRGYTCKHSIVYMDGREWLSGVDWKRRKAQLEARAEGQCEHICQINHADGGGWERCQSEGTEPDHVIPRAKSHDDRLSNLQLLCNFHHVQKHPEKHKLHWRKHEIQTDS